MEINIPTYTASQTQPVSASVLFYTTKIPTMSAFIPSSGLSTVTASSVQRPSLISSLRRPRNDTTTSTARSSATTMVAYPYTGSGYGACGVPYANNQLGQFLLKTETADIVQTASSIPFFRTLVSLLKETGLDYELQKGGPFTVFAPMDDAFYKLLNPHSFSTYSALLRPENREQVTKILSYHVIPGQLLSTGIAPLGGKVTAKTLSGDTITVMSYNRKVTAGSASVVRADILCTNGVIHIVDSVLTPMSYETPEVCPEPKYLPDSLVSDFYGKMLSPRQALGIDPSPVGNAIAPY